MGLRGTWAERGSIQRETIMAAANYRQRVVCVEEWYDDINGVRTIRKRASQLKSIWHNGPFHARNKDIVLQTMYAISRKEMADPTGIHNAKSASLYRKFT